jgi:iron complex outermembrane recepter protein
MNFKQEISIMKYFLTAFIIMLVFSTNLLAQTNILRGKIVDQDQNVLPGASVVIVGKSEGTNANEAGEYRFDKLSAGRISIQASFVGYQTVIKEIDIKQGENILDLVLEYSNVSLGNVTVTSQKREQQIIDVPITMAVVNADFLKNNNISQLDNLSEFVPGLQIRMQGTDRPSFVIRGLTSDEVSPAAQPRISVFYNNVPISRANGAAVALFDMQQVDVLKGPQGTLFGRGAQIGAINYISNKPENKFAGLASAGFGNYNQREVKGALNIPVVKDKLLVRVAGLYDYSDGYIKNTFGGTLNGRNTLAGRFSATYLLTDRDKADLVLNYQKDRNPGLGFMSMKYPNTHGSTDPYGYTASLEQGKSLANNRELFDATLTLKHNFSENNFLSSITSYRKINTYTRWDGDGTAAAAIDMSETDGAKQFYQELRDNYSVGNKLIGSIGLSYWNENADQKYWFSPNEQNLFHLFFNTGFMVLPNGSPVPVTYLPNDPQLGPLAGFPLVTNHQEENKGTAVNNAFEGFADANYLLTDKLSITVGIRLINEWIKETSMAEMTGGDASTLGALTGNYPNLFFKISDLKKISTSNTAATWRAGLKYSFSENTNVFANYARGRRPKVLQFTSAGEEQILDAEIVNSYDLGLKTMISRRIWIDAGLFYYNYLNFQSSAWVANATTGEFNYIVKDGGKATSYGFEGNLRASIIRGLNIFGNYAFIHARFADKDVNGDLQEYAGHSFRLTPEHSFAVGLNAKANIAKDIYIFGTPSWSYKTKIFFEDANTEGIEQSDYRLLNFTGGIGYKTVELAFFCTNLTSTKYIISAGNTGSLFGDPTEIPGAPAMVGAKINWKF